MVARRITERMARAVTGRVVSRKVPRLIKMLIMMRVTSDKESGRTISDGAAAAAKGAGTPRARGHAARNACTADGGCMQPHRPTSVIARDDGYQELRLQERWRARVRPSGTAVGYGRRARPSGTAVGYDVGRRPIKTAALAMLQPPRPTPVLTREEGRRTWRLQELAGCREGASGRPRSRDGLTPTTTRRALHAARPPPRCPAPAGCPGSAARRRRSASSRRGRASGRGPPSCAPPPRGPAPAAAL